MLAIAETSNMLAIAAAHDLAPYRERHDVKGDNLLLTIQRLGHPLAYNVNGHRVYPIQLPKSKGGIRFIENSNLQLLPNQMRGCIIWDAHNNRIGIIEKSVKGKAIINQIFPPTKKSFYVLSLHCEGYYLQQISGVPIKPRKEPRKARKFSGTGHRHRKKRHKSNVVNPPGPSVPHPPFKDDRLDDNGVILPLLSRSKHIKMDVRGPDVTEVSKEKQWSSDLDEQLGSGEDLIEFISHDPKSTSTKLGSVTHTIYCPVTDFTTQLPSDDKGDLFCVPFGEPKEVDGVNLYKTQEFVNISKNDACKLVNETWCTPDNRKRWLCQHQIGASFTRLVPARYPRVKLCDPAEWNALLESRKKKKLEYVCHEGFQYLFGREDTNLLHEHSKHGTVVSASGVDELISKPQIHYKFAQLVLDTWKEGYGGRERAGCLGQNLYTNPLGRLTDRPHPRPFEASEDISAHQYFREKYAKTLYKPQLERFFHYIGDSAVRFAQKHNPPLMEMVGSTCSKLIVTCGARTVRKKDKVPGVSQYGSRNPAQAFCNGGHVDTCDILPEDLKQDWREHYIPMDGKKKDYCLKLLESDNFCLPTTCAWQVLFKQADDAALFVPTQYFVMDGLGLALPIVNGLGHHFLGAKFSHRTSVCQVQRKCDGMITSSNEDDFFLIFAWGTTGGSREARLRREAREAAAAAAAAAGGGA